MATTPTDLACVLDEDHRGYTEWRVERMRVHPARADPATVRAQRTPRGSHESGPVARPSLPGSIAPRGGIRDMVIMAAYRDTAWRRFFLLSS
jgi:hypothetical protein